MDKPAKARQIRRRLRDDFAYYAPRALKIRTKDAEVIPFSLNAAQKVLHKAAEEQKAKTGRVRVIILKGRQQGLSTYVGGRIYHRVSQAEAKKAIVATHHAKSTDTLFTMTKRYHENVPAILKPSTKYSSKRELVFDNLDSSYTVATAGGDSIARGETLTHAHLSELAFWPAGNAEENLNGLLQAIPNSDDTEVYIESTANGMSGPYYRLWQSAVAGENEFIPVFIPWFLSPEYREKAPEVYLPNEEELKYASDYGLDRDQLWWRRMKINSTSPELFRQEYPATPEEAFLTTGSPVFPLEILNDALKKPSEILVRQSWVISSWQDSPSGELCLYHWPDPGEVYYIGADVSMGLKDRDWSVAQVLDSSKRQVATWRGRVYPDYFAEVLYQLGKLFEFAKIAVEANNHGLLTVNRLYKELGYPNVYVNELHDKTDEIETPNLGFLTTAKTKPLIVNALRAEVRDKTLQVNDKTTLKEMVSFVVKPNGKAEAEDGCFDDCVMSLAIANHIHDGIFEPVSLPGLYVSNL